MQEEWFPETRHRTEAARHNLKNRVAPLDPSKNGRCPSSHKCLIPASFPLPKDKHACPNDIPADLGSRCKVTWRVLRSLPDGCWDVNAGEYCSPGQHPSLDGTRPYTWSQSLPPSALKRRRYDYNTPMPLMQEYVRYYGSDRLFVHPNSAVAHMSNLRQSCSRDSLILADWHLIILAIYVHPDDLIDTIVSPPTILSYLSIHTPPILHSVSMKNPRT
ncbi:hypothetical protein GGR57DRAFT_313460 [Xylariaceae sp. FL1272]|nr:hypothetical protein GGR57DRAFT_313460 [Xylariaceae sp. FL1272]